MSGGICDDEPYSETSYQSKDDVGMKHKDKCVFVLDPKFGEDHRIPIDGVTIEDLWRSQDKLLDQIKGLEAEAVRLKAEIYDIHRRIEQEE
jgi:hypothetical protein